MRITPVSFTGIKNVGFAKISSDVPGIQVSRNIMNMELTDDNENKDLSEFRKLVKKFPMLENDFNNKFVNIELTSVSYNHSDMTFIPRLNGQSIPASEQTKPIINFMKSLVDRVSKFKGKDFKTDPEHYFSWETYKGLIYNEDLDDYVSGMSGELDILKGSGVTESFADCFAREGNELTEQEEELLLETVEGVSEVLHNPQYVHNGSIYLGALLKGYSDLTTSKHLS